MRNLKKMVAITVIFSMVLAMIPSVSLVQAEEANEDSGFTIPVDESATGKDGFIASIEAPIEDFIPISNRAELEKIGKEAGYPLNENYCLTADIDLSGEDWIPIGDNSTNSEASRFTGNFDGQGHVISNMTITDVYEYIGLFGYISGATIKNVGLEGTNIDISSTSTYLRVGGICGGNYSDNINTTSISNCYNTGDVIVFSSSVDAGGICGSSCGTITINNCYNTGDVRTSNSHGVGVGGICGFIYGASIYGNSDINCFSTIRNCYNTGDITATSTFFTSSAPIPIIGVGGIFGCMVRIDSTTISNCYNAGSLAAFSYVRSELGGIGGEIMRHSDSYIDTINNCYNVGDLTLFSYSAEARLGGLFGYYSSDGDNTITNCYWNINSQHMLNNVSLKDNEKKGLGNYGFPSYSALTSEEMRHESSYNGFDFDVVWKFESGVNNDYPILQELSHKDRDQSKPKPTLPVMPPPTSEPPTSEPPTSEPPTSEPPTSEPPTSEPPTSEPPTSELPTSEPPTSEPTPTTEPTPSPTPAAPVTKKQQLAKPTKLKLTAKKATWKNVANNSGYTVKIIQGKKVVKTVQIKKGKTSYKIPGKLFKKGKKYKFTIVAKGKGKYKNSKLATSKVLKIKK